MMGLLFFGEMVLVVGLSGRLHRVAVRCWRGKPAKWKIEFGLL